MGRESTGGLVAPEHDRDSAEWWQAVAEHRFVLPRCRDCTRWSFPPGPTCSFCGRPSPELSPASGGGRVYSWVIVYRSLEPAFDLDVPYVIVAVDLAEGVRMFGRLCGGDAPLAGLPVEAVFYEVDGQNLIGFRAQTVS